MIAGHAPPLQVASPAAADGDATDIADVAFVWATLNALDCVEVDSADAAVVRSAHQSLQRRLDALGTTSTDMFEHIADAVERGDWRALGLAEKPD